MPRFRLRRAPPELAGRTVRTFEFEDNPWPIVEAWANDSSAKPRPAPSGDRLFEVNEHVTGSRYGDGNMFGPWGPGPRTMAQIGAAEGRVTLHAWVENTEPYHRFLAAIGLANKEWRVETDWRSGFYLPEVDLGRQTVDKLLAAFGQQPIMPLVATPPAD